MNFGPLNQSGGERRLNVAVTRAREALLVFGSLRPEHIDLARTSATGVAHLKQFLTFAEHGARAFATTSTGPLGDFESPFEAAVAERLRARGWTVHPQIGVSGFRVDLGIVDPDAPGAFLAGIECDGATYHRSASARDRDRLRQAVLEGLGWRVQRIWSTDWWTNAERETHRVHLALVELLEARRNAARAAAERVQSEAAATSQEPGEVAAKDTETEEEAGLAKSRPESAADESSQDNGGHAEPIPAVPQEVLSQLDPAKFYEDDYRTRLASLVQVLLAAEGPMRDEVLAQRVARAHGFQRTGRRIREAVYAALPAGVRTTTEGEAVFLWPPNVKPEDWSTFRDPPPGQYRDPLEIPMEELRVLARRMLTRGGSDEEVVTAMRDAIGMRQMREASRQRCLAALVAVRQGITR
jgi:very-short-patch-repair endonuclease